MRLTRVQRASLWLYSLMMLVAIPLLQWKLRRRGKDEPAYLLNRAQRIGHYADHFASGGRVWIHAVSLGETRAAAILLRELRLLDPSIRILLTHGTATGWEAGKSLLESGDEQVWQPWDTPDVVRKFIQRFRPRMGIILETEVWPNWVDVCVQEGVPLHLVNARLSEKSLHKARRLPWLALPAFSRLTSVMAQTRDDADRLRQLGVHSPTVMGNLKFDVQIEKNLRELGCAWKAACAKPILMLASSRQGEEKQLLDLIRSWEGGADRVQWLIVPRHPQRFEEVVSLAQQYGWQVSKRSEWVGGSPAACAQPQMWIGDTLGEMQAYYHSASVAWLGGSFEPFGGQNLIEAVACGCPVVMGPHTFNFAQAAEQANQAGAAVRVKTMADAWAASLPWLEAADQLSEAQKMGVLWLSESQGASRRCACALINEKPLAP